MTQTPQTPAKKPRKWTRWLLIASLALNLLIVGAAVGFAVRGPGAKPGSAPNMPGAISLLRAMPDSHRGQVRDAFREHRETLRAQRDDVSTLRKAFLAEIEKETPDKAELERLLASFGDIESRISERGRAVLLQIVMDMDQGARAELAARARDMSRKGRSGHKKKE